MLAKLYTGGNPTGWIMSEKLNGFRAIWDGLQLLSRTGNPFPAPAWFLAQLPADTPLDGELWASRDGGLSIVQQFARSRREDGWRKLKFIPFDLPASPLVARDRARELETRFPNALRSRVCANREDLARELWDVHQAGGEGVMLRFADARYEPSRHDRDYSGALLKVRCQDSFDLFMT